MKKIGEIKEEFAVASEGQWADLEMLEEFSYLLCFHVFTILLKN